MAQDFSPLEVRNDWNRFSSSFIHVRTASGNDILPSIAELNNMYPLNEPEWDDENDEDAFPDVPWDEVSLEVRYITRGGRVTFEEIRPDPDMKVEFCPQWMHAGYTMVPNISRDDGPDRMVWYSLSGVRQYRYGLSVRAFERRECRNFYSLGRQISSELRDLLWLHTNGPTFASLPINQIPRPGVALTPSLAVHYISDRHGALCYHANTVVGLLVNGTCYVEDEARHITQQIQDDVAYVDTNRLSDLWTTEVLPASAVRDVDVGRSGVRPSIATQWLHPDNGGLTSFSENIGDDLTVSDTTWAMEELSRFARQRARAYSSDGD